MNKRLQMLESMTEKGATDPFVWYGLAVEYKNAGRIDDALATFEKLRSLDPDYLPMYLIAGQTLVDVERESDAISWLRQGRELASRQGNQKALSEIEVALLELGEE